MFLGWIKFSTLKQACVAVAVFGNLDLVLFSNKLFLGRPLKWNCKIAQVVIGCFKKKM